MSATLSLLCGPQRASLQIGDGHAVAVWSSGSVVGRFGRALTAKERASVEQALATARSVAPAQASTATPRNGTRPSGTRESLVAPGVAAITWEHGDEPPAGYEELLRLLVKLRVGLVGNPIAALELQVLTSPLRAQLRHVGTEPVTVRLGKLTVSTTRFGSSSRLLDSAKHDVDAAGTPSSVAPGWTLPLGALGVAKAPRGGVVTVTVAGLAVDFGDGAFVPAQMSTVVE